MIRTAGMSHLELRLEPVIGTHSHRPSGPWAWRLTVHDFTGASRVIQQGHCANPATGLGDAVTALLDAQDTFFDRGSR
jgi:hypothetical protein